METALKTVLILGVFASLVVFFPQIVRNLIVLGGGEISVSSGGSDMAISTDNGKSFKSVALHGSGTSILEIKKGGGFYYAATDHGLLISKDGGLNWYSFSDLEKKIDSRVVLYGLVLSRVDNEIYAAGYKSGKGFVFSTRDNFFSLKEIWSETNIQPKAIAVDDFNLYLGLSDGRLLKYNFGTQKFSKIKSFENGIESVSLTNDGRRIFVVLSDGKLMQNDGSGWQEAKDVSSGLSSGRLFFKSDRSNQSSLYLAQAASVLKSKDGDWVAFDTVLPKNSRIDAIEVVYGSIFLAAGPKLYISKDNGYSWGVTEPLGGRRLGAIYVSDLENVIIVGSRK